MKIRLTATAVLLLSQLAFAQETRPGPGSRPVADLAVGSEKDRMAALIFLEDSRSADAAAWRKLLDRRDDPRFFGRVLRGLGRVGEPELKPLLVEELARDGEVWTRDAQRGAAIAVGLFGDPDLLAGLAKRATPRDVFFALGLMKKLPADAKAPLAPWTDAASESRPAGADDPSTFTDPVVAALRWGAVLTEPVFAELAKTTLASPEAPNDRKMAAVDYFARSKALAPPELKPVLTGLLAAADPELAGLAARALAKSQLAGVREAEAIEAAFVAGTDRVAQVDRIRALAAIQQPTAKEALVRAIGLSKSDSAVRRTVMEALPNVPWHSVTPASLKTATALVRAIAFPADGEPPAPADVRAAAVKALGSFGAAQFQTVQSALRLADPWQVRASAAETWLLLPAEDKSVETNLAWRVSWRALLSDPDRRVRIAALEAVADRADALKKAGMIEALTSLLDAEGSPRSYDPVELSLIAKIGFAGTGEAALLGRIVQRIPDHEAEALQAVLDRAGSLKSSEGDRLLRRYLESPEISLRKRAAELLAKNGFTLVKLAPLASGPALASLADGLFENPAPSALIETSKGNVTIQLFAVDAPLTVQNFLRLAKSGFYDGILWHRVVPAFVAQAGCPRGDGWGGPGYTIRCEVNDRTYRRGSVGMALAGKDTGGSQFFICHRALPHLDGRYTLFGQVIDGMDVVDKLGQDDVILKIREI